jgi:protein-S-isoprenylcysteine O-methyltransferase Ste14
MSINIILINAIITSIAFLVIVLAVALDFVENHSGRKAKKEKRSWVETGTMFVFFFLFYFVIRFKIGVMEFPLNSLTLIEIYLAWFVLVLGTWFNVAGRVTLGKNWANQIKIYKNHTLKTEGVYSMVRHPLYASLIWIFYACSIIYFNVAAFFLNTLVFVPMMYYRAKQEEKLLSEQFKNYKDYRKEVGMFIPKFKIW